MRHSHRDLGSSTILKFAGAALIACLSSACSSDMMRFSDAPFSNPFASSNHVDPASTGSVNRAPVSKVQTSSLAAPRSGATYSQPLPGSTAQVSTASRVAAMGNSPTTGSVNGWSASGGTPVTLGEGDTVEALSGRYGVPVAALRSVNGMSGKSQPSAGQQFIIPAFNPSGKASTAAAHSVAPVQQAAQASPRYEEVKSAPSRAHDLVKPLATPAKAKVADDEEDETPAAAPKVPGFKPLDKKVSAANEQVDRANAAAEKARAARATLAAAPTKATPAKSTPAPKKAADDEDDDEPVKTAEAVKTAPVKVEPKKVEPKPEAKPVRQIEIKRPEPVKTSKLTEKEPETTGSVSEPKNEQEFRWPARGRVISGYGSKSASGTNDGINIAVPEGTPVKAAEGGTVAYAGEEIKGYGKMVLIRHPNGYVSAYAHNGDLNVKRGDPIKRGQVIAKSGQSGNVTSPQLHFELRKGAEPVDPSKFLEGN